MTSTPAAPDRRRKARLQRLREDHDPIAASELRTAVCSLLRHPLLLPDAPDPEAYRLVRRHRTWLSDWFAHHADWNLVVSTEAVRLHKVPASDRDATRGATEPRNGELFTRRRYVLFCLALAALERGDRQISLGRLAESLAGSIASQPAFADAGLTWSLETASDRRDFVHAVRLLLALGVLRRVQGDEERFVADRDSDVLYGVARPVLALLLAPRRSPSLLDIPGFDQRLEALRADPAAPDTPDARNRAIRIRVVRHLLDDPVLYYDELDPETRTYLDRQRPFILRELSDATGLEPEVRAEGIALADLEGDCTDLGLPDEGTEGHLTLLLAAWLAQSLRDHPGRPVTLDAIRLQTARFIRDHHHHWRRDASQPGAETWLSEIVLRTLAGLALVERHPAGVVPRPALGRFALRRSDDPAASPTTPDLFAETAPESSGP